MAAGLMLAVWACSSGGDGSSCTVEEIDGETVITCDDGTSATIGGGADGGSGTAGKDGKDGADGADGTDGTNGTDGTSGTDGEDGDNGADGTDGQDADECTTTDNGDGTATVDCPDGSSTTWQIGYTGKIVFGADLSANEVDEIFLIDFKGGNPSAPIRLNSDLVSNGDVDSYTLSEDGNSVVYMADQEMDDRIELYYVDLSGATPAAPQKINTTLATDGEVHEFRLSADGTKVLYIAEQDTQDLPELYLSDLSSGTPSAPVKLSGTMVSGGDMDSQEFEFSKNGNAVVFTCDRETEEVDELYHVDISGSSPSAPVKLNDTLASDRDVFDFVSSADGTRIIYRADRDTDNAYEAYYVDFNGASPTTPIKLNDALPSTAAEIDNVYISDDGNTVVFRGDMDTYDIWECYYVDLSGASPEDPVKMNGALVASGDVWQVLLSPDGSTVVYRADEVDDSVQELYLVDLSTGTPTTPVMISQDLSSPQAVSTAVFSGDGNSVIYTADVITDNAFDLYYVNIGGDTPTAPVLLNQTLPTGGDVQSSYLGLSSAGDAVVYWADQDTNNVNEAYLVPILPNFQPVPPIKLNPPLQSDRDVDEIQMTK